MYVKNFKFKGKPFGLNPDPKFFFNSRTHKRAISCLGYGLGQGQGFVVITGESGSGKTMLMSALLHMLEKTSIITCKIVNTQLQGEDMLRYLAAEFGLQYTNHSKVVLLKKLEEFLDQCRDSERRAVVIIDEAQNLSEAAIEELRMVANMVKGNEVLLQFVLLGTNKLQQQLYSENFEPLKQRIVASYQLRHLDEEETRAYIIHRLRTVGWAGKPDISPGAYVAIYEYSNGLPAKINMLCSRLLQAADIDQSGVISEDSVHRMVLEMNQQFSDGDVAGSLVESVIDALTRQRKPLTQSRKVETTVNAQSVQDQTDPPLEEKTLELDDPALSGMSADSVDHAEDETPYKLIKQSPDSDEVNIPVISEQVSMDQALTESRSRKSDEELDSEVSEWLKRQKQRISTEKRRHGATISQKQADQHAPERNIATRNLPMEDTLL